MINGLHDGVWSVDALDELLAPVDFSDRRAARRCLERLAPDPQRQHLLDSFLPHLLAALSEAAGPDRVLASLERFIGRFADPSMPLATLSNNPRAVEILVTLFSGSQFLTEILLRNPDYFERLVAHRRLAAPKSSDQDYTEAQEALAPFDSPAAQLDRLRRFQSWELLRIGACDLLDLYDLPVVTRQLSNLAGSLIRTCLKIAARETGGSPDDLTVLGMGKLGGRELNYSSDIDLLFLAAPGAENAQRMGQRLIDGLARVTDEGFLYRVDMRLRPWGQVGPLVSTVDGHLSYLKKNARPWEKQALLKARVVAGNRALGRSFLEQARPLVFELSNEEARRAVFAMKQRTEEQLRRDGREWGEVKLGEGSIRDVEFTLQYLQLSHGLRQPELLSAGTLDGLARMAAAGLLTAEEFRTLSDGYIFLRTIEHYLQMMDYRQTHALPQDPEAIAHLARRLGFHGPQPGEQFLARYQQHVTAVRAVYLRHVGSLEMNPTPEPLPAADSPDSQGLQVHRHLDRMAPSYVETFQPQEIARHAELAARLNDKNLVEVDASPLDDGRWRAAIVGYDFPGELSLICGLMFVHGLNIASGDVFTYEPLTAPLPAAQKDSRRKIVDTFVLTPIGEQPIPLELWLAYADDLAALLEMLRAGKRREAQVELGKRVATSLQDSVPAAAEGFVPALFPLEILVDNEVSEDYTVLRITSQDTFGFLYEFTNALAFNRVYIARVNIDTVGSRIQDTLYVTDESGNKIIDIEKQRELRAATVLIKHFTHLLPYSPNPESALLHFREFIAELFKRSNWPDELASLERPEVLHGLARLLGVSDFLWDDFLRMQYVNLYPVVRDVDALSSARTRAQLQAELQAALALVHAGPQLPDENAPWVEAVNAFKDREMFRIDMRHILGHTIEFGEFSSELTDLVEVVVNAVFHLCHEDLRLVYGSPRLEDGGPARMSVLALGKFGGNELGFASDIELMFVYSGNGMTDGPRSISTAEFYERLVEYFMRTVQARREGIFEIDLRLRPYGKAGSLAVSLDAFRRYFAPNGPAWAYERQALVKLRAVAGDDLLGQRVSALRDEFVYAGEPFDVTAMRAMRERQTRHLVTAGTFHLKYSLGGLVDVEYLVQGLQMANGRHLPALRQTNTRAAMAALAEAGLLSLDDYTRLRKAHTFLRWLIDSLRVVRGNAKDITLPSETSEEFAFLARRMRYGSDTARLHSEVARYTEDVREINARLLK